MSKTNFTRLPFVFAAALYIFAGAAIAGERQVEADHRESRSTYGRTDGSSSSRGETRLDRYRALESAGKRDDRETNVQSGKTFPSEKSTNDFWIYHADVELFYDDDLDGYFYGIDVLFDADTLYEVADVYAILYLSYGGGPWNEYAATDTFSLYGATSDDEYVVATELMSGYPTGSYDLLIELYDAFDGSFVAAMGPQDNSELSLLPLEDFERDEPHRPEAHHHGGGGAMGWPGVLSLALFLLLARRSRGTQQRHDDEEIHSLKHWPPELEDALIATTFRERDAE